MLNGRAKHSASDCRASKATNNHMIYLFRKFNKQIIAVQGASAWDMFRSNGEWKYRPIYLGAVSLEAYRAIGEKVREEVPIDPDLQVRVNTGADRAADRELQPLLKKRTLRELELLEELAATADKTQTPQNMDVVNGSTLQPHEKQAVSKLMGGV